ncbi:MAG: tetratricopeptide repeat-containing sensor histidine kinase [Candidatus Cloacimonetes bacterium]|nr:tetratricopeptide repeat-containing sensor histidine kinase [Candidatus Cloacimonadota bacterium]MCF7813139.1 tetratricopeptide repeat-containing sensor histidine kinase [Candidatus Cloacimonadota bacterium]MCF7867587.1 tetratricopeptide repeat-containing sensor histidine kinase [Candidatus Cloacimonadota bacterium]MCF7883138.1 tetratricopeptide repeat-containing sensor histidine kinase [Candidatus Cloacimonadota bacterium]
MAEIDELKHKLKNAAGKEKIELLCQISDQYIQNSDEDRSLAYLQEALQLAQQISEEKYIVICFQKLGLAYWRKNEFSTAKNYFEKALTLYEKLDNKSQAASLEMAIGVTLHNMGKSLQAKVQLRKAVYKIIRVRKKNNLAGAYNWLGIVYDDLMEDQAAMKYFLKGLHIQEELGNEEGIGVAKNSIGLLHLKLKHLEQAEKYLKESLEIRQKIDDKLGVADCLNNLGMLFSENNDLEMALEYYQNSLKIRQQIGGKAKMANTYNNIGNIYAKMGKIDKALKNLDASLKIMEEIGNKSYILQLLHNICDCHFDNNDFEAGKAILDSSQQLLSQIDDSPVKHIHYQLLSSYYEKKQDYQKAFENFVKATKMKEAMFNQENSAKIMEIQAKYEMEKQIQQNRYLHLKNVELQKANATISIQNKELKERNDHIQLTNKMLRHDIINNLSVMNSAMRLYNDSKESSYLEEIPRQIEKSINLIRKLRNLSNLLSDDKKLYPIDLRKDILEKTISNYSMLNIEINGKGSVLADQMLESVFDNLFSNAVKHSQTEKIIIDILVRKQFVQINFADFGIGIPEEIRDKIFEESFAYGNSGNTGLGLFIVKKAVENYGGSVRVKNNQPSGTMFMIRLKKA